MNGTPNIPTKTKNETLSLDIASQKYTSYFNKIVELDEADEITRANCKFCQHDARREAEKMWERTRSYAPVERFFDDYRQKNPVSKHGLATEKMNFQNIKAHIHNHYEQQLQRIQTREYLSHLKEVLNSKIEQDEQFEIMKTAYMDRFLRISGNETIDESKRIDGMVKLGKIIVDINLAQEKLRGNLDTIQLYRQKMVQVWVELINSQESPAVKQRLIGALDRFQELVQDSEVVAEQNGTIL